MKKLSLLDIILLGITNFALYVGAGNIIFPPILGLLAGSNTVIAAVGFLITGVGLPVIAAIALAKVSGRLNLITLPIGVKCGLAASVVCYLCIGPLYAIPRTATVSYALTVTPFVEEDKYLPYYSAAYFIFAALVALYPSRILDTLGKVLSPVKIISLIVLIVAGAVLIPGEGSAPQGEFVHASFSQGIINGYLTLDTLASLAFGIVIVDAIRTRGIEDNKSIVKYACISGSLAGLGMMTIYIGLFNLGYHSYALTPTAENGAEVLSAYVNFAFGAGGSFFLALVICVACVVTAIGLICACSSYFSKITGIEYRTYVFIIAIFGAVISNLGLTHLIKLSVPILIAIYPMFIVLVFGSFISGFLNSPRQVIAPTAALSLIFGFNDALESLGLSPLPEAVKTMLPMYKDCLSWLIPCLVFAVLLMVYDRLKGPSDKAVSAA